MPGLHFSMKNTAKRQQHTIPEARMTQLQPNATTLHSETEHNAAVARDTSDVGLGLALLRTVNDHSLTANICTSS